MPTALIVIDMLNRYEHEDGERLAVSAREIVGPLQELVAGARASDTLVVYVNDNHGDWSAGRCELVERALGGPDSELVEPVIPEDDIDVWTSQRDAMRRVS